MEEKERHLKTNTSGYGKMHQDGEIHVWRSNYIVLFFEFYDM
jgi:hypothetical protein